jgi:hypothetical protein
VRALGEDKVRNAFVFLTIRNPWARLVSFFLWTNQETRRTSYAFEDFVKSRQTLRDFLEVRSGSQRFSGLANGFVDRVCKFENLENEFKAVSAGLNLQLAEGSALPHLNQGAATHDYRTFYTPSLRSWVLDHHSLEMELGEYSWDDSPHPG